MKNKSNQFSYLGKSSQVKIKRRSSVVWKRADREKQKKFLNQMILTSPTNLKDGPTFYALINQRHQGKLYFRFATEITNIKHFLARLRQKTT